MQNIEVTATDTTIHTITTIDLARVTGGVTMSPDGRGCCDPRPRPSGPFGPSRPPLGGPVTDPLPNLLGGGRVGR
jgi:hypothetical protein